MSRRKIILQAVCLIAVIGFAFYLARLASGNDAIKELVGNYGYFGIYFIAVFSGFNFIVPIPAISFMPLFIESGLSFFPTVLLISLGMSTADCLSFVLARTGRSLLSDSLDEKLEAKFFSFPEKYYRYSLLILFLFAALAPLPNELLLVPLAFFSGYTLKQIIPVVFAGNLIFNILFAKGLLNVFQALFG